MGYHSPLFTNKELRRLLKKPENYRLEYIKGCAAQKTGCVKDYGSYVKVFGSDFIAKVRKIK